MLDRVGGIIAALLSAVSLVGVEAKAEPAATREASPARTTVVLGVVGVGAAAVRADLMTLLGAELERSGLSLIENQPTEPLSAWAAEAASSERVLAALLLDGRGEQGWRLVVIDVVRGRAIARDLPGGIAHDAASIEAVVSIATSAALALREGLEIASSPLAAVVGDPPSQAARASPPETKQSDRGPPAPRGDAWSPRAFLGASVASFSPAAPTTEGLALALGLSFRARAEARVIGSLFVPTLVRGPFGEFRVARAFVGAAAGPVFAARTFSFTPEAGVLVERLHRYDATPAAGLSATEAGALYRFGGSLSLRLRHTLSRPICAEVVTGAVYFGRRARFSARSAEGSWAVDAWPTLAFAQIGLGIALD